MRTILYTCITNNRDAVPPVPFFNQFIDYFLFADPNELDPAVDVRPWTLMPLLWRHPLDPGRTAKWHKHNPMKCFPGRTDSIWMDASHWPTTDISWFPAWFLQRADIACFPHAVRTDIRQEAEEVFRLKFDNEDVVREQMLRYRDDGFPAYDNKLYDTSVLVRRHCPRLKDLSEMWWNEIEQGSRRDQLSLPYCLWKLAMNCELIVPGHARHPSHPYRRRGSPYFNWKSRPTPEPAKS